MLRKLLQSRLVRAAAILLLIIGAFNAALGSASAAQSARLDGVALGYGSHLKSGMDDFSATLQAQLDSGVTWVREEIPWKLVEPKQDEFRWQFESGGVYYDFDTLMQAYQQNDIKVLLVLNGGPGYLESNWPDKPVDSAALLDRWRVFVATVAARYGSMVDAWQIGFEPNRPVQWGRTLFPNEKKATPIPDPALYTRMLIEGYNILKGLDSNDLVVLGGLSTPLDGECALPAADYLTQLWAAGAWPYFDVIALDLFPGGRAPEEAWAFKPKGECASGYPAADLTGQVEALRAFVDKAGGKPVWVTALGWREDWLEDAAKNKRSQVELVQADYLVRGYVALLSMPEVERVFWFSQLENPRISGFRLAGDGRQALANLSHFLKDARAIGQVQGQQYGQQPASEVFEYRFRSRGETIIYIWRAEGGLETRPVILNGLDGMKVQVFPADAIDLETPAFELEVNSSGNALLDVNERPLVLVARPASLLSTLSGKVGDWLYNLGDSARAEAAGWLKRQKRLALAHLMNWLRGIQEEILGSLNFQLMR